ncbi:MAG: hypothetical protein ACI9KS_000352 [Sulfitobacter sp.]
MDRRSKFRFHKGKDMTKSIADALTPIERGDLHAMLDSLLDSADSSTDALDPTTFWTFMHVLALGRGIGDDLNRAAEADIAQNAPRPDDPAQIWRTWQGLILGHVLGRLDAGGEGAILPQSFDVAAIKAHVHNIADRKPELPDMFRHGRNAQGHKTMARVAQRCLVGAVVYYATYHDVTEAEARRSILPTEGHPDPGKEERKEGFRSNWSRWKADAGKQGTVDAAEADANKARDSGLRFGSFAPNYAPTSAMIAEWFAAAAERLPK